MPTENQIETFIRAIAEPQFKGLFNPWSERSEMDLSPEAELIRRERLRLHLSCPEPKILLIGEAAGYQGCRFSGIPFTSERLLLEGSIPRISALQARISMRNRPWSEPSATIVWKTLHALNLSEHAVLSNAVPWHPEGERGPLSNRTPRRNEQEAGRPYLKQFLGLFPDIPVAALGKTASAALTVLDVQHTQVRHPAYGGARKFSDGLSRLVG